MADPCDLPAHLAALAEAELGETPERRRAALEELRQRISELAQDERLEDISDVNLVRFLRSRKYNVEDALKSTIKLQKFKAAHPEWTSNLQAEEFNAHKDFFQVLETRGPKGELIVCLRPKNGIKVFTPEFVKQNPLSMIRCNMWFLETLSRDPQVQVCGLIICNTYHGFTLRDNWALSKVAKVNEQLATLKYISIMGFRLTGAFLFDQPAYISWLWALIRPVISDRIRSRIHLCGSDFEPLHSILPKRAAGLPICIGGDLEDSAFHWVEEQIEKEKRAKAFSTPTLSLPQEENAQHSLARSDSNVSFASTVKASHGFGFRSQASSSSLLSETDGLDAHASSRAMLPDSAAQLVFSSRCTATPSSESASPYSRSSSAGSYPALARSKSCK